MPGERSKSVFTDRSVSRSGAITLPAISTEGTGSTPSSACSKYQYSPSGLPISTLLIRVNSRSNDAPSCGAKCQRPNSSPSASSRSEEHTSELQSLMRISYAVFCLKKNINRPNLSEQYQRNKAENKHQSMTNKTIT